MLRLVEVIMKINYFVILLAFSSSGLTPCTSLQAAQKSAKTIYLSKTFTTEQEAQQALSHGGFFLFDIHGVLFDNKGEYFKAFKKVKNKKKFFKQGIKAIFSKKTRAEYRKRQKEGNKITERKFDTIKQYAHLHKELIDFSNNIFTPNKQMKCLLTELKDKGHKLYLLSNIGNVTLDRLVKTHPDFFSIITDTRNTINRTAADTGSFVWKPRLDAFTQALNTIDKPDHAHLAIFVDDQKHNVEAAHKAGLNAIHFTSHSQFFHDVKALLKS
jgi:FMN phosphatase YigB (HAD superfamily)